MDCGENYAMKKRCGPLDVGYRHNDFPGNGIAGSNPAASGEHWMYGRVVYGGGLALVPRLLFARPTFQLNAIIV